MNPFNSGSIGEKQKGATAGRLENNKGYGGKELKIRNVMLPTTNAG